MSKGFIYSINLNLLGDNALSRMIAMLDRLDAGVIGLQKDVSNLAGKFDTLGQRGAAAGDNLWNKFTRLAGTIGVVAATMGSLNAAASMEGMTRGINFASGGAEQGSKSIEMLRGTVEDLRLPLRESYEGFKTLQAGIMGSGISVEQTRDIFSGMAEAAATFGLNAEETKGSLLALSQMASKGTVSAEELRGQLGERLPGAFALAAKSIGVSTEALGDMLKEGKVLSKDFLPKFAQELHKTFGESAKDAANGATANFNRFNNSLYNLKVTVGQDLMPAVLSLLNDFIIPGIKFIGEHRKEIGLLISVVAGGAAGYYAFAAGIVVYNAVVAIAALETITFTGVMVALNLTMLANPIVLIGIAIGALVAAVIYAWNNFEGFRATVSGVWAVMSAWYGTIIDIGKAIVFWLIDQFKGFHFYVVLAKDAWGDIMTAFSGAGKYLEPFGKYLKMFILGPLGVAITMFDKLYALVTGKSISATFNEGYQNGLDYKPKEQSTNKDLFYKYLGGKEESPFAKMVPDSIGKYIKPSNVATTAQGDTASGKSSKGSKDTKGVEAITGGGTKNITINVAKFQDAINIYAENAGMGIDEMTNVLMSRLTQILNQANQVQTQ
jgi:tape measure domain-containing protein